MTGTTGSLEATDAAAEAVRKDGADRVTLDAISKAIVEVEYHRPSMAPHMTVCFVMMENGYIVVGKSAPADVDNYDKDLGERFAFEDAKRQIWPLMGYALLLKIRRLEARATEAAEQ